MQDLTKLSARAVVDLLRTGRGCPDRGDRRGTGAHCRRRSRGQRGPDPVRRARPGMRAAAGATGRGRPRLARRPAGADQGPGRGRGGPLDAWARPSSRTMCPISRPGRSSAWRRPAASCWARPTRPSSVPAPTPSTRCSVPRATRGTRRSPAAARPAGPRWRWPPAWPGSPTAPTSAARCARRPRSAASSACGLRRAGCPHGPSTAPFATLAVEGPMARDVRDVALMLDVMAGFDARDPLSYDRARDRLRHHRRAPAWRWAGSRSRPISAASRRSIAEIAAICRQAAGQLRRAGCRGRRGGAGSRHAVEVFTVLRAALFATNMAPLLEQHRDRLKPEVVWNIERGLTPRPPTRSAGPSASAACCSGGWPSSWAATTCCCARRRSCRRSRSRPATCRS